MCWVCTIHPSAAPCWRCATVGIAVRKESIGTCDLYFGDCISIMENLSPVNHVIADPPYEKEAHRTMRRTQKSIRTGCNDDLDFAAITDNLRQLATKHMVRLSGGWVMVFCQAEAVGAWRDQFEAQKAKYKRTMVWIKPDSSPQFNSQMPAMGYESIPLAWCGSGHSSWNGGGRRGVFTHLTNDRQRDGRHPTEKPIPLMMELVSLFTKSNQTVLDPFMGSGSTGVACVKSGRKFIGIEKDPVYFDIACERITKAYTQPDLFIEQPKGQTPDLWRTNKEQKT